jgi:ketosteroid isomerase-like protein
VSTLEDRVRRLEDVEAIRGLDARYCRLIDTADWSGLVSLFTPDGTFDGLQTINGQENLLTFFGGLAGGGMRWWHHVGNHEIEVAADTADVRSMLWQPCVVDGLAHIAAGRYTDRLVRTADGWRYERKQVRFDYWGPLTDGWDQHRFGFAPARVAATPGSSS